MGIAAIAADPDKVRCDMGRKLAILIFVSALGICSGQAYGQSDEARRHFDRGMAAVEMARSPEDFVTAINEFKQATILAPDWPDAHFNLAKVFEAAERFNEAIASYRKYLQVASNAPDADAVRSLINRLELKAEQTLSVSSIIDVLTEFSRANLWQYTATVRTADRGCRRAWGELQLSRQNSDTVKAIASILYYTGPTGITTTYQNLPIREPVLRYVTSVNVCGPEAMREFGDCTSVIENEIKVVSKTHVTVSQVVIRGGLGAGAVDGDRYACEFRKTAKPEPVSNDLIVVVSSKEKVVAALASGVDINAKNQFGYTLIQQAVIDGTTDVVDLLASNGADLKVRDTNGRTLLHLAATNGNVGIVSLLLAKGADINSVDNGGLMPLDTAISWRKKDVASLLISKGANLETKDKYGYTPLLRAILVDEVALLIDLGADPNVRDNFGRTLLHRAASENNLSFIELLASKGADINIRATQDGNTPLHEAVSANKIESAALLVEKGAKLEVKDDNGYTPLHRAVVNHAYSNYRPIVEMLIGKGANINSTNNNGYTPLQSSIENCGRIDDCAKKEMFDLLIEKGADINAGTSGRSTLQIAFLNNRKNMIDVLALKGVDVKNTDVNWKDERGRTALHIAAEWGDIRSASELIANGADINARDNDGRTPLHSAVGGGKNIVVLLIEKGADLNALDKWGSTPIFRALANAANAPALAQKYMEVFSLLLEKGANINAGYKDGSTFLHDAVANGNLQAVEILIRKGVDINARNKNGKTPLQIALEFKKNDIAELLKKNGAQ